MLHVQGSPTKIITYSSLGHENWYYDRSKVTFSLPDRRVAEWDNDGNLKAKLLPKTGNSQTPGYFTRGSSQDDVLHVQGSPTKIITYSSLGHENWYYDRSKVTFSLPDRRVAEWDNDGNLKAKLLPKTGNSQTPGYFTRGSSQDDVLHVQGSPTKIITYSSLGHENWYYDRSKVTFSLPDRRVAEWDNDGNLKAKLLPKTGNSQTPGYFTRGSSQDDVLHVQGSPTKIIAYSSFGREDWYYDRSKVTFSLPDRRVTEWENGDGSLKFRLELSDSSPTPTATSIPMPTPLPPPTSVPTAAPPAIGGDYFTRGSSQDDVLHVQGTPTEIHTYDALGKETWYYDWSRVTFSLPDRRVTEWDNEGNLKVRLLPKSGNSETPGYFTRGSSQDDVLHVQGTLTEIHTYDALGKETWYYDWSRVTFSLPDRRVTEWDNEGNLKVRLLPKSGNSETPGYFTRGSSQDDVLHVQGTPTEIHTYDALGKETWYYDWSKVTFSLPDRRVTEWDNEGNLKVR